MFNIISSLKWLGIGGGILGIIYGLNAIHNWHLSQIDQAVNNTKLEIVLQQEQAASIRENELRNIAKAEREAIEQELKVERDKAKNLERMLLIDHDLDRLLQKKPGLILIRVNEGTEQVLNELGELTQ